jgi:DNA-directed RNA polymerase subunit RPC12/RpoP
MENTSYKCPVCSSRELTLRYEASYVYSYVIDSDAPGLNNSEEFLSYLYDKREQKDTRTYVECNQCGTQYPYTFLNGVLAEKCTDKGLSH